MAKRKQPTKRKKPSANDMSRLNEVECGNFDTLLKAAENNDLALVRAVRKSDRKEVALVSAVSVQDGMYQITPLAVMVEGNPFEDFEHPTGFKNSR